MSDTENYFLPSVDAVPLDWIAICETLARESKNENAACRTSDNKIFTEQQAYQCYQSPKSNVTLLNGMTQRNAYFAMIWGNSWRL